MKKDAGKARWPRRYRKELGKYLELGPGASPRPARAFGRQAAALGLETLDVARVHQQALAVLAGPGGSTGTREKMVERAKVFFTEAIFPIEKTHLSALRADARANQLTRKLHRRTLEASAANRDLKQGIARRLAAEAALKQSAKRRDGILRESRLLRNRLRKQMRGLLAAQEAERKKTGRQLQDEIAQTLVAIKVRLLTLQEIAKAGTETLKKEFAETRQLVKESVKMISEFTSELGSQNETQVKRVGAKISDGIAPVP